MDKLWPLKTAPVQKPLRHWYYDAQPVPSKLSPHQNCLIHGLYCLTALNSCWTKKVTFPKMSFSFSLKSTATLRSRCELCRRSRPSWSRKRTIWGTSTVRPFWPAASWRACAVNFRDTTARWRYCTRTLSGRLTPNARENTHLHTKQVADHCHGERASRWKLKHEL